MDTEWQLGRRRALDGLRGVAILLVLVRHFAGPDAPEGVGHVGVGLFFALSGYLITGLLLDEFQHRGTVDLFAFYARRVGRLVPGLVVMVLVCTPLLAARGSAGYVGKSAVAALTYTTNYADIMGWLPTSAFGQTWSLAIEEHFYLIWAPLLIWSARRGGARSVLRTALIGAALSLGLRIAIALATSSWAWVARGSVDRGDALLIGCAAAAGLRVGWAPPGWVLPTSLAVTVGLSFILPGENMPHRTLLAVGLGLLSVSAAALVVSVDYHSGSVARILGARPLAWVGVVSYSLYLWHVPILELGVNRAPTWALLATTLTVSAASYYYVEAPARRRMRSWVEGRQPTLNICSPALCNGIEPVVT